MSTPVRHFSIDTAQRKKIREYINAKWKAQHESKQWTDANGQAQGAKGPAPVIQDWELDELVYKAEITGLDPLAGHIHCTKRKGGISLVTSIDAYRLIADRTGNYAPGDDTVFEYNENKALVSAKVFIRKFSQNVWHQYSGVARLDEYQQTVEKKGNNNNKYKEPTGMWKSMPHNQLAKCAEALGLRRGFPAELAGLYVEEEMDQAQNFDYANESQAAPEVIKEVEAPTPEAIPEGYEARVSEEELRKIHIVLSKSRANGDTDAEHKAFVREHISSTYGVASTKDLTAKQAAELKQWAIDLTNSRLQKK